MNTKHPVRFDIDALLELAGEKVFARGEAYFRDGQVQILAIEPHRVLAQVAGTEVYRTELTGRGTEIDGECSCPAFEDWGMCKHMVATALATNAGGDEAEASSANGLAHIRAHLKAKGVDALIAMVIDMALRDPALFRRLDTAAATTQSDDTTLEDRLRKAINGATDVPHYVEYREVQEWASDVDAVLDALTDIASGKRAGLALRLAEHAIERVESAVENIDDSNGHCGALLARASAIHLAAAQIAKPEPIPLARDLFAREMTSVYDTFHGTAANYADVLGETGLAEYRRLASDAWEQLPSRVGAGSNDTFDDRYEKLKSILDFFAARDGDVAARIALRTKDLSSPWQYQQLAEFCLSQGRTGEALRWAEEGLWLFEDVRMDRRLLLFTAELLTKAGRNADAALHLWRTFEKTPDLELYARLRTLGGDAAHERAVALLEARLIGAKRTRWDDPADLLICILTQEMSFEAAWSVLRQHGASINVKEALARASEQTHSKDALAVYAERVEQLADASGNHAYEEAAKLVKHMAALRPAADQASYVTALKVRFGRKRNFMKLLA